MGRKVWQWRSFMTSTTSIPADTDPTASYSQFPASDVFVYLILQFLSAITRPFCLIECGFSERIPNSLFSKVELPDTLLIPCEPVGEGNPPSPHRIYRPTPPIMLSCHALGVTCAFSIICFTL